MITEVRFDNFKVLRDFSLKLGRMNVLVGPNNSGKSTVLDSFRVLSAAYRFASHRRPELLRVPSGSCTFGYHVPTSGIPIGLEHVHSDYNDLTTTITFRLEGGKALCVVFPGDGGVLLYSETSGPYPRSASSFRQEFAVRVSVVPTLGPLEPDETLSSADYVARWAGSHRASRLFRNIWFYEPSRFDDFKQAVESTWPGMTINSPELDTTTGHLRMFYLEDRVTREVAWAGYGFQVWLQMLTHIVKGAESELLVIDEPEVYLHPDLQRRVINMLRRLGPSVLIATHSVEIIDESEPEDILLVEKSSREASRLISVAGVQRAVDLLGSRQNVHLMRLARGKRVLFVEGKDQRYLALLARACGYSGLFSGVDLTVIPLGGYSNWDRISHAQWAFTGVLGNPIAVAALFDRDFRCGEEVEDLRRELGGKISLLHVLERKEIENYLLVPSAIERAVCAEFARRSRMDFPKLSADDLLFALTESFKAYVYGQLLGNRVRYFRAKGIDVATLAEKQLAALEVSWSDLPSRLRLVPGKEILAALNQHTQTLWGVSISAAGIAGAMRPEDVDNEVLAFFDQLACFCRGSLSKPV